MNELKRQLKTLAAIPGDSGLWAFRALIRKRTGDEAPRVEQAWRNMILVMPDLLERIRRDAAAGDDSKARKVYSFMLAYLYSDKDLIPEDGNGLFGYVDDAYLVAGAHRRLAGVDAMPEAKSWQGAVRRVFPSEAGRLDEMLEELFRGRTDAYHAAVSWS